MLKVSGQLRLGSGARRMVRRLTSSNANRRLAPQQMRSEIQMLLNFLRNSRHGRLESEAGRVPCSRVRAKAVAEATLITVDLWMGSPRERFVRAAARRGQGIHVLSADCRSLRVSACTPRVFVALAASPFARSLTDESGRRWCSHTWPSGGQGPRVRR
jgi:hypothetical protein